MKLLKKYGWLIIFPIIIGAVIGYRMYHKPHFDMERAAPAHSISAVALYNAYEENELKADELYLGKIIEVKGTVQQIDKPENGQMVIHLQTDHIFGMVSCELDPHSKHADIPAETGTTVTLKGVVTGFLSDVVMNRCIVIQ